MTEFTYDFLQKVSRLYRLSLEQEKVFLLRFGQSLAYAEIAKRLDISKEAAIRRMSLIYKKLNISGETRGKEARLKSWLNLQVQSEKAVLLDDASARRYLVNHPNPIARLQLISQKLRDRGNGYVPYALQELGTDLPIMISWIANHTTLRDGDIIQEIIQHLKFVCKHILVCQNSGIETSNLSDVSADDELHELYGIQHSVADLICALQENSLNDESE